MLLFIAILILISIYSSKISAKYGIPLLILFILIGIIVGSDVLNIFYFDNAVLTKRIADILLIFIIFDGGFRVNKKSFNTVAGPAITLATFGVVLTSFILGFFIHLILKIDLLYSMMISSIISSTDAAAVFMITKQNPVKDRLATTLNVESAANDPMAIVLTITFIQIITESSGSPLFIAIKLIWQFMGGILIGYVVYKISGWVIDLLKSDNRGNYNVLLLGLILLAYGLSDLVNANGIIAVFFMGYWLGNSTFTAKTGISNFLESIAVICNVTLFIMLGLLAFPTRLVHIWKEGIVIALVMMFIARPIAVLLSTLPFKYRFKEKVFLMWGGIKGAVPIVLATYPAVYNLDPNGVVFDIIFFAVLMSCLIQGTTLGLLAKLFKFTEAKLPTSPYIIELHTTSKSDIDMYEFHITDKAPCVNKRISELDLGKEVLISSIIRNEKMILPKGNVVIKANDIVYMLGKAKSIDEVNRRLN